MNHSRLRILTKVCLSFLVFLLLSGCATMDTVDPRDPFEQANRTVYSFNEFMDEHLFDHVSHFYQDITPDLVDRGISNMFSNVRDISVIANDFLQFKLGQAISDVARVVFNSTIGLLGFFDVSSHIGLPKHNEDFGQTLAYWGVGSGPYLVLPFLGPSTVRDGIGYGVDSLINPVSYIGTDASSAGLMALNYVDFKADLLSTGNLIAEAALDKYEFVKNAYLERRNNMVHDREYSEPEFDEKEFDEKEFEDGEQE